MRFANLPLRARCSVATRAGPARTADVALATPRTTILPGLAAVPLERTAETAERFG